MNKFVYGVVPVAAMVLLLPACSLQRSYKPAQIKITAIKGYKNGLEIYYQPFAETQYHCPGVNYRLQQNKLIVSFVREKISITPRVDAPCIWDAKQGYKVFLAFELPQRLTQYGQLDVLDSEGCCIDTISMKQLHP